MTGRQAQFNPKSRINGTQICTDCFIGEFYVKIEKTEVEGRLLEED